MKEKELRIKRPLIGVKVAKLPFLTSARDKALESQALMEGERYFSTAHFPLTTLEGKLSGGVPNQPLNTPGTSIPCALTAAWWGLGALHTISPQAQPSGGSKSLQALQPSNRCYFLCVLPHEK